MSDLQCPATLVVARHAEAAFVEHWFSDEGGSLTPEGRRQALVLARSLSGRRVSAIYSSDLSRAVQTAEIAAAHLGVAVTARKSLREVDLGSLIGTAFDTTPLEEISTRWRAGDLDAGFAGGESGTDVVARHRSELEEIADLHRGETVLVVGHQTALGIVLPALARNLTPSWARDHELGNAESIDLEGDADGWVSSRWGEHAISSPR